jgi:hypothetical protein
MGILSIFSNSNSKQELTKNSFQGMRLGQIKVMMLQYLDVKNKQIKTANSYNSNKHSNIFNFPKTLKLNIANKHIVAKINYSELEFNNTFVRLKINFESKLASKLGIDLVFVTFYFNENNELGGLINIHIGSKIVYHALGIYFKKHFKYSYAESGYSKKAHINDTQYLDFDFRNNILILDSRNNALGGFNDVNDFKGVIQKHLKPKVATQVAVINQVKITQVAVQSNQPKVQKLDFDVAMIVKYLLSFYANPSFDFTKSHSYTGFVANENCPKFAKIEVNNSAAIATKVESAILAFDPETEDHYASISLKLILLNQELSTNSISFTINHQEDYGLNLVVTLGQKNGQNMEYKVNSDKDQLLNLPIKVNLTFQNEKGLNFAKPSLKQDPHYVYKKSLKN